MTPRDSIITEYDPDDDETEIVVPDDPNEAEALRDSIVDRLLGEDEDEDAGQ